MKYKVCIPTAGLGSRLGKLTRGLNKALVEINNKPAICYIIDKYEENVEFVIPVGYGSSELKQFLNLAYPERFFKFVEVDLYEGKGSGLGYTLLKAKKFLQAPFIFNSCDTIVRERIPILDCNWIGFDIREKTSQYRTIDHNNGVITNIFDKGSDPSTKNVYIGIAGIKNYKLFWKNLNAKNEHFITQGESYGLNNLINYKLEGVRFNWFDTGNPSELKKSKIALKKYNRHNILEKQGETIWFVKDKVIKYSKSKEFINNRIKRAKLLEGFVPKIIDNTDNMYCYKKEKGEVISKNLSVNLFLNLLNFSEKFWVHKDIKLYKNDSYINICKNFYKEKTSERVKTFFMKYPSLKEIREINSKKVDNLEKLLERIEWDNLCNGIIGKFHGDFHFENILWNPKKEKFIFLDWRQDFGGDIEFGDIYYDFAKLKHGMIIQHEFMIKNKYSINYENKKIFFNFIRSFNHIECEKIFLNWLEKKGYKIKKVNILTALIFLNIAPLHHNPYDQLLFFLGYYLLNDELNI